VTGKLSIIVKLGKIALISTQDLFKQKTQYSLLNRDIYPLKKVPIRGFSGIHVRSPPNTKKTLKSRNDA